MDRRAHLECDAHRAAVEARRAMDGCGLSVAGYDDLEAAVYEAIIDFFRQVDRGERAG